MDNIIKLAIKQPIAVAAFVFLIMAFGVVALQKIPIQMTPDIDKPVTDVLLCKILKLEFIFLFISVIRAPLTLNSNPYISDLELYRTSPSLVM